MGFVLQKKQEQEQALAASEAVQRSPDIKRAAAANGFEAGAAALMPPVQMDGGNGKFGVAQVQAAAQAGVAKGGGAMPHLAAIQASFGRHDVGGIAAHTGGAASAACEDMGAAAYATGNSVAFKGAPDLHTAAHEAAHVVQQRGGVSVPGGVGKSGDAYEKHADQVADAVVQGKSAEGLLDKQSGGAGGAGVQQKSVQAKGGIMGFLGRAKNGTKDMMPGGHLWAKEATKESEENGTNKVKTSTKLKVWGTRLGIALGLLIAPAVTLASTFIGSGIVRTYNKWKNKRKNRKKNKDLQNRNEQTQPKDPKALVKDKVNTAFQAGAVRQLCEEMNLKADDVNGMILLRLGCGGFQPNWDEKQMEYYRDVEGALCQNYAVLRLAFEKQEIPQLGQQQLEESEEEVEEKGEDVTEDVVPEKKPEDDKKQGN